jgi:hypothetical protein
MSHLTDRTAIDEAEGRASERHPQPETEDEGVKLKAGKIESKDRLKPLWAGTVVP